jgi:predicted RNase H-like HicB family nuclease
MLPSAPLPCEAQTVEQIVNLHVERLPEGIYLATSDDVPGLVAQRRTRSETLEIACDVWRRILEARGERECPVRLKDPGDVFDYALVVSR